MSLQQTPVENTLLADPTQHPLVSVVTICRNAATTITRTIHSVQNQTYPNIEHVFVDGVSSDATLEVIQSKIRPQDRLVSEPDDGISDALNKGVKLAQGTFVQFLHADDALPETFIERAVAILQQTQAPFVFGDLIFEQAGEPVMCYRGEADYQRAIARRMPNLNHPTCVHRRDMFTQVGPFDTRYRCAMDHDWFLRATHLGLNGVYSQDLVGWMNMDGVSNTAYRRTITEVYEIAKAHGRNGLLARAEWVYRMVKTTLGAQVKAWAKPIYFKLRALINPSVGKV